MRRRWISVTVAVAALTCLGVWLPGATATTRSHTAGRRPDARVASGLPPIHHVFTIVLENESASVTFGPNSPAPYLSKTLRSEGAYLPDYHAVGHNSLDNYIAMISGQAPNLQTQADCQIFTNVAPTAIGADGQVDGNGCVYPASVPTIASQLTDAGLTWRDYNDSMGSEPSREASECGHPAVGAVDDTQTETPTDQYASRHDPFVYFHSIIDDTALCDSHVVNLDLLPHDLATAADTPNYVFITPGLCDDGHDAKCANGGAGGLTQVNAFLQQWVPQILASPAFTQQNGLLMIVFDEAATTDTSSCCGEIPGPGSPLPGESGPGGGDTGAVLLSPCIAPGTVSATPYNHYTMLRSVEDLFGLSHLGYAQLPGETSFGSDVFTGRCSQTPVETLTARAGRRHQHTQRVTLRWSATAGTTYLVQARRRGSAWKTLARATTRTSLADTVRRGFRYQFRVRGTDATGTGPWATAHIRLH